MRRISMSGLFVATILCASGLAGCGQEAGSDKSAKETEDSPSPEVSLAETGPEGKWQGTRTVTDVTKVTMGTGVWENDGWKTGLKQKVVMEFGACTGDPCTGSSKTLSVSNQPVPNSTVAYTWDGKVIKIAPWEDTSTYYKCVADTGKEYPAWKLKTVRLETTLTPELDEAGRIIKLTGPRMSVAEVNQLFKADTYAKAISICPDVTLADAQAAFGTPERQELHQDTVLTPSG